MKEFFHAHKKAFRTVAALSVVLLILFCVVLFAACGNSSETNKPYATVSDDFRTDYYVGETLSVQGYLKMYVDAGTFTEIPITEEMVSGFDTSAAGTVIVKVTYGEFVASVAVTVHPMKATSITLDASTLPRTLYKDKPFPSTVTFSAVFSDGTKADGIAVTPSMLGGFDPSYVGTQNVSVTYLGASTSFIITVKKDVRVSIELIDAKKEYAVGEALSVTGAQIKVTYESGNINYATLLPNNVSGFSTAKGGEFVAKVTYSGLECEYKYFVRKTVASFALTASSLPAVYEKGDVLPDTGEGVLTYDDGTTETISLKSENLPEFSTATAGEKQIEVVVSGVKTSYHYTVLPSIVSATPYGFTSAVRQNSDFNGLGELIVVYESKEDEERHTESIPLSDDLAVRSSVDEQGHVIQTITTDRLRIEYCTSVVGDIVQKLYFRTQVIDFTVHVYSEDESETAVDSIILAGVFPSIVLGSPIDTTGVQVTINYKYKSSVTVDCESSWVSAEMPDSLEGDYIDVPVTVTCFNVTSEELRTVRVLSIEYASSVTSLAAYGLSTLYLEGDVLSLEGVTLHVVYGGGYRAEDVPAQAEYILGFDTSTTGEKTMTITYGETSIERSYRVISQSDTERVTGLSLSSFRPLLFVGDTVDNIDRSRYNLNLILGYGYGSDSISLADEGVTLEGGPFTEAGTAPVTVTCGGVSIVKNVTVYPEADKTRLTSIRVEDTIGSEVGTAPDLSAYYLTLTYGYGRYTSKIPLSTPGITLSPYSTASEGLTTVTVAYQGVSCVAILSFRAGASDNVLQRLELASDPPREFAVGAELSGVRVIAVYNVKRVAMDVTLAMASDFSTETPGEHSITITYGGKSIIYNYTVVASSEEGSQSGQEEGV